MYNTSQKWKENIYKNVQSILNIYIDDVLINPDYVLDFKVGQTLFEENLELGSTTSKYIEFKIYKEKMPQNMKKVKVDYGILIDSSLTVKQVNSMLLGKLKGIKVKSLTKNNGEYEIIPIGIFNIDEYKENDDNTLTIKCIDNMSKFEFNYDGSSLTYPATLLEVLKGICLKAGVELGSTSFLNCDEKIAVYDNTVSAREYIGYIAESAGGFAFIGRDGKLYIRRIYQDEQEIPLELFGSYKWGEEFQVSKLSYEDGVRSYKYGDTTRNNLWINQENMFITTANQIQNIYNQVKDLTANSFEGKTIIDPALDVGDKIIIDGKPVIYQGELDYQTRFIADIKSAISTKQKQETTIKKESQKVLNRRVQSNIDQIEGKISQLVQETTEHEEKLTEHEQTIDSIADKVSNIADITRSITGITTIELENCIKGNLLELHIKGNNTVFESLKLSDNLYLSDDLYLKGDSLIVVKDQDGKSKKYELNIQELLRQNGTVYDEYVLKEGKAQVIRRINEDGTIKDEVITEDLGTIEILLEEGNNTLSIKNYDAEISAKWAIKSEYSEIYATNVAMDSEIKQTAQEINLSVNKKLEDYSTTTEMNSAISVKADEINQKVSKKVGKDEIISEINQSAEEIKINADKIDIDGKAVHFKTNISEKAGPFVESDFKKLINYLNDAGTLNDEEKSRYDINEDGELDAMDMYLMTQAISNGGTYEYKGNFEINPYSAKKAITLYNENTNQYEVILSLINNHIKKLTSDEIEVSGKVTCESLTQTSLERKKKNFEKLEDNAIETIKNIDIYKYNLKSEKDTDKKHLGFVIGDNYNYSKEVTSLDNTGVDNYSFTSLCCKAIQEQQKLIEKLQNKIEEMEEKINGKD
jgi:hypothetical protein